MNMHTRTLGRTLGVTARNEDFLWIRCNRLFCMRVSSQIICFCVHGYLSFFVHPYMCACARYACCAIVCVATWARLCAYAIAGYNQLFVWECVCVWRSNVLCFCVHGYLNLFCTYVYVYLCMLCVLCDCVCAAK